MMESMNLYGVHLELTSDCNLRCTYCAVSQPTYQAVDFELGSLDALLENLERNNVRHVQINGHGETTMLSYWTQVATRLLDRHLELSIITNMARELTEEEVDVFSRFAFIETSIDSSDRIINRDIRRKVDVRTQYSNLLRVRGRAIETDRPLPKFGFSIVVYDRNVLALDKLVSVGLALNIEHFRFCSLFKHPDVEGVEPVQPVTSLKGSALTEAANQIRMVIGFLEQRGVAYLFMDGLLDVLKHVSEDGVIRTSGTEEIGVTQRIYVAPKLGETRDCVDPWSFAQIRANGDVALCCWSPAVGNIKMDGDLAQILASGPAQEIRKGLLSGKLPVSCKMCIDRPTAMPQALKEKVERHMQTDGKYEKVAVHARVNAIV
jgi:MoaA/NifB/PqqE/SkfB family radical SAM enzyme